MATVKIVGDGFQKLRKFEAAIPSISREGVEEAALTMKKTIVATMRSSGVDGRLRNVGRNGSKLNVRYDVKGTDNPTALVRAIGPWQIVENPTRPHEIKPKARRTRGNKQATVLTPGGPRRVVHHRGTRGKHIWARGTDAGKPLASKAFAARFELGMRKYFRG